MNVTIVRAICLLSQFLLFIHLFLKIFSTFYVIIIPKFYLILSTFIEIQKLITIKYCGLIYMQLFSPDVV